MSSPLAIPYRLILVALGAAAGLAGAAYLGHQSMRRAEHDLHQRQQALRDLQQASPPPTPSGLAAVIERVNAAERVAHDLRGKLQGGTRASELEAFEAPAESMDAFFDLAAYVERMRAAAAQHHVGIAKDERFGFVAFDNGGLPQALIAVVSRQQRILQYLLESLFAFSPERLERVECGAPIQFPAAPAARPADWFEMDPDWSLGVPGLVDTLAFRITFTGDTPVVRHWLNRLAEFDLPVVVRQVAVTPLPGMSNSLARSRARPLALNGEAEPEHPLITAQPVRFTVTLEYLQLSLPSTEVVP